MGSMDVDCIMTLCGRSIFAEEYRGNLRAVQYEIDRYKREGLPDPEQHAELLRCSIILSILAGRLSDAYSTLDQLKALLERLPPHWGLHHANYKLLLDYTRRYPPCIRFRHEPMMPVNLPMLSDIAGPNDIIMQLQESTQLYFESGTVRDQSVYMLLQVILYFPIQLRTLTARLHPLAPDGKWKAKDPPSSPLAAIAEIAASLLQLKERAVAMNAGAITLYLERLIVELHYAINSASGETALKSLYSKYEKAGDLAGMANCKLMEGDNHLSPPFASPVTHNLIPVDTSSAGGDNSVWDPVEARIPLKESEEAKYCYDMALKLFQEANCPRGQAAVLLRQGCCLHTRACALDMQHSDWQGLIEDAGKKFEESLALFDVDEANAQVVKAHQILLDVTKGNHTADVKRRAADIGKWGREAKNEGVSHFLGLLLMRFARREWERYSRFDAAVFCYECAYECCVQLDDIIPAFNSLVARAQIHHDMFNFSAARTLNEQCLSKFDAAVEYYESKIASCAATPMGALDREDMLRKKFDLIWTFESKVARIYARTEDMENYARWQERFFHFLEHDESFQMMRDAMQNRRDLHHRGQRLDQLWDTAIREQKVSEKFHTADILFQRAVLDGDLQKGEDILYRFIDEAPALEAALSGELFRIVACQRLGDVRKAREILDSITDATLFNGRIENLSRSIDMENFFPDTADNVLYACVIAKDWKRGLKVLDMTEGFCPSFLEDATTDTAMNLSFRLGTAGLIALHNGRPELAFRRLLQAHQLTELRRRQTTDIDARVGSLSTVRVIETLVSLAQICLRCAEIGLPMAVLSAYDHGHPTEASWEEHALLFLEEGRARAIVDSLRSSTASEPVEESRKLSESIYKRRAMTHLRSLSSRTPKQEEELTQLEAEMEGLELSGWSSSANALIKTVNSSISPRSLYQHIKKDAIVIDASFSRLGCLIFGVTNRGIERYHQSSIRDVDIRRQVMEFMQIMRSMTGLQGDAEQRRKDRLDVLSRQISAVLLGPFADIIRTKSHVIFSVSQPLTAFPFSALIFDEKPLLLHAALSQTPSLTVLYHLSQRQAASATPTVSVFTKGAKSQAESSHSRNTRETYLAMAGIEAVNIAHMFSTWPIEASNLSRAEFQRRLLFVVVVVVGAPHRYAWQSQPSQPALILHLDRRGLSRPGPVPDPEQCQSPRLCSLSERAWKSHCRERRPRLHARRARHGLSGVYRHVVGRQRFCEHVAYDAVLSEFEGDDEEEQERRGGW
ncbi:hypothetical protein VTN77DRAFT_7059 [Rasamsonia byssochlamydoides]|uniref:uncharacterized protein n=1 Tax=Rasamsonia byssochlamydoides TaxID=89139 RepID=UPI0037432CE7